MMKRFVPGLALFAGLVSACQSTLIPATGVATCTVTANPTVGTLDTPFSFAIASMNAVTCTYGLDGKSNLPIACSTMLGATGASFGVGTHTIMVRATGVTGNGTCQVSWTVATTLADMAGPMPVVDMAIPAVPDMATPIIFDMTAPPPDLSPIASTLDPHMVTFFDNPPNLADWPETTQITDVEFQYQGRDGVHVEFSKRDDGSWPDVTPPNWGGSLEYTLGMVEFINGQWYGSAAIQFWRGLDASGGNVAQDVNTGGACQSPGNGSPCQVAKNWYYDGRWGNLAGYQPAQGEIIGIFVVGGNVRGVTDGSQSPAMERSNIVLMPFPGFNGAQYTF